MNQKNSLMYFLLLSLLLMGGYTQAQTIKVEGEIRTRGELRNGFREPLADSLGTAFVNNLRTRLSVYYGSEEFNAKVTLQDTQTYGSTGPNKTGNSLGVYEAWGEYLFTPELSGVLGRQILQYDDGRLLSSSNWSNTPNAHDLLRLKYESSAFSAHLGGAWNNANDVLYESVYDKSYKSMIYGWGSKSFGKLNISAIWINEGFQKGTEADKVKKIIIRNTLGGNLEMNNKEVPFSFLATAYYQFGHDKSDKKLSTFLMALKTQYKFSEKIMATLGGDYFSGSKYDIDKNKNNTFNKLYGGNHAFNGSIEYWLAPPAQGLVDIYGAIEVKAMPKLSFNGSFHTFSTAQKMQSRSNKGIGSELDITVDYKFSPSLSIQGGWSAYFTNKGTEIIKNQTHVDTRFPQWAYLMISFKPVFFSKTDKD